MKIFMKCRFKIFIVSHFDIISQFYKQYYIIFKNDFALIGIWQRD